MGQYAGSPGHSTYCYTEVASFISFLQYCSPSAGFYSGGKDNRGGCTNNPSGRHPVQTIGAPLLHPPPIFTQNALSAATLPVYPGLGQAN